MIDALENGSDVAGQVIPLSSFSAAEGDEDSTALTVTCRSGPSTNESKAIVFVDKAQRDEFVVALVGALGPGWQRGRKRMNPWIAGFLDPPTNRPRGAYHLGNARGGNPDRSRIAARELGERQAQGLRHGRALD